MSADAFPLRSRRGAELRLLVGVFASVADGREAFYVSSPLTTGQRAFEWHRKNGHGKRHPDRAANDEFRENVVEPNREDAAHFARRLRDTTGKTVIDPTAMLDLPDWSQDDYRFFWGEVIKRYCDTVVFRDGWQYSSGCAYEFLVGEKSGARLLRQDMSRLEQDEAVRLIGGAIQEVEKHGVSADFLREVRLSLAEPGEAGIG